MSSMIVMEEDTMKIAHPTGAAALGARISMAATPFPSNDLIEDRLEEAVL